MTRFVQTIRQSDHKAAHFPRTIRSMVGDPIQSELRLAIEAAREQFAADPREGTADRLAREIAESLSSEANEQAAYFAVRRWFLEGRAIG